MIIKKAYFKTLMVAAVLFSFTACSDDDDTSTNVPPQTTETTSVSLSVSLGSVTRATGVADGNDIKTEWETGDKVYLNYTKTFSTDEEIINVFTLQSVDSDDPSTAVFTCSSFLYPRGIEEGQIVYVGDREVSTLSDLGTGGYDLGSQSQNGNNSLDNICSYVYMASSYFSFTTAEELAGNSPAALKHTMSVVTLQINHPESWTGTGVSEVKMALSSNNVSLGGTTDNTMTMSVQNATWDEDDDTILVHFVVNMLGLVNDGDSWTVTVTEAGTGNYFDVTYSAKSLEGGKHYTSLVSSDHSDYESNVYIEIPGFEDGGSAF